MNSKSIKALLFSSFAALVLSSCSSDDNGDTISDQTIGQCLTYTIETASQTQAFNKISFSTQFNYSTNTVDITVYGLQLPVPGAVSGTVLPKMELKSLPWTANSMGWKVVDVDNVKPDMSGDALMPTFKSFKFSIVDVFSGQSYTPGIIYDFELEVNGSTYEAKGSCMTGTTKSVSPEGAEYIPEKDDTARNKPAYWIDLDFKDSKADIYLFSAKFLVNMPSLNLVFPDVPFSVKDGKIILEAANLIPEYKNRPFDSFPISQLKATVDFASGMTFDFHCGYRGADYAVNIVCKY